MFHRRRAVFNSRHSDKSTVINVRNRFCDSRGSMLMQIIQNRVQSWSAAVRRWRWRFHRKWSMVRNSKLYEIIIGRRINKVFFFFFWEFRWSHERWDVIETWGRCDRVANRAPMCQDIDARVTTRQGLRWTFVVTSSSLSNSSAQKAGRSPPVRFAILLLSLSLSLAKLQILTRRMVEDVGPRDMQTTLIALISMHQEVGPLEVDTFISRADFFLCRLVSGAGNTEYPEISNIENVIIRVIKKLRLAGLGHECGFFVLTFPIIIGNFSPLFSRNYLQ